MGLLTCPLALCPPSRPNFARSTRAPCAPRVSHPLCPPTSYASESHPKCCALHCPNVFYPNVFAPGESSRVSCLLSACPLHPLSLCLLGPSNSFLVYQMTVRACPAWHVPHRIDLSSSLFVPLSPTPPARTQSVKRTHYPGPNAILLLPRSCLIELAASVSLLCKCSLLCKLCPSIDLREHVHAVVYIYFILLNIKSA